MASDTSKAVAKRSSETSLMPPPPPPKRIKRPPKVLDEDTYTDGLSYIIARDFFPGLLETQTQQEYLDAINSKDREWIAEAGRKLTEVMTPGPANRRARGRRGVSMTPSHTAWAGETPKGWQGDTPASVAASEAPSIQTTTKPEVDLTLSLSAFQAKYTSEDNESFNAVLDKQNAKNRQNNAWLWTGNKVPSSRRLTNSSTTKLLSSAPSSSKALTLPKKQDTRPPLLTHRPTHPHNTLMFPPSSIEDTHTTVSQASEAASRIPPKHISYASTRLAPAPSPDAAPVPPSPSLSVVHAALSGHPRREPSEAGYDGSETPRVGGWAFVDAEPPPPSPAPEDAPAPEEEAALLARLGPADAGGGGKRFSIAGVGRREGVHLRLVERAKAKAQGRMADLNGGTPRFASSPVVKGGLTPAARRLLERVGTPRRVGEGFGVEKGRERKEAWTPGVRAKK